MVTHPNGSVVDPTATPTDACDGASQPSTVKKSLPKALSPDFYDDFLSAIAKARQPSPSKFIESAVLKQSQLTISSSWPLPVRIATWLNLPSRGQTKSIHFSIYLFSVHR